MRDVKLTYRVVGATEPAVLIPHLVSRLASRLRERSSAMGAAAAAKGVAVFSAVESGHTASVIVGVDEGYTTPMLRVTVESGEPIKWAALSFPLGSVVGLVLGAKLGFAVWGALFFAAALGVGIAYALFRFFRRWHATRGTPTLAATRIGRQLEGITREVVGSFGFTLGEAHEEKVAGVDSPLGRAAGGETLDEALALGDEKAWTELMVSAARSIPRAP